MKELTQNENTELAMAICELIDSKKGEQIEIFDVSKQSSEIDFMVVATASNTTQTKGIADFVEESLKKVGIRLLRRDGVGGWIVLDYNQILVHIFLPEIRDMYHLDKIWANGKNIFKFDDVKKFLEKESKAKKQKDEKEVKKEKKAQPKKEKETKPAKTKKTEKDDKKEKTKPTKKAKK